MTFVSNKAGTSHNYMSVAHTLDAERRARELADKNDKLKAEARLTPKLFSENWCRLDGLLRRKIL